MGRTDVSRASNARTTAIVEYGIDPRGWSLFAALSGRHQRGLNGRDGTVVHGENAQRSPTFTGYAVSPQRMTGLAPLGVARTVVEANSTLTDERASGALDNAGLRIFAERLKRRR